MDYVIKAMQYCASDVWYNISEKCSLKVMYTLYTMHDIFFLTYKYLKH